MYNAEVTSLAKHLKKNPKDTILILRCFACHGMIQDGRQIILTNEFEKSRQFYKVLGVEQNIRENARNFSNAYLITIFACCREIRSPGIHTGGFDKAYVLAKQEEIRRHNELALERLVKKMQQPVAALLEFKKQQLWQMEAQIQIMSIEREEHIKRLENEND